VADLAGQAHIRPPSKGKGKYLRYKNFRHSTSLGLIEEGSASVIEESGTERGCLNGLGGKTNEKGG